MCSSSRETLERSSPIRTIPSALELHQVSRCKHAASRGLGAASQPFTAGQELHLALKILIQIHNVGIRINGHAPLLIITRIGFTSI